MGYTHYWRPNVTADQRAWSDAMIKASEIVRHSPVPLAGPEGDGEPELSDRGILFNGTASDGNDHEAFVLWATLADHDSFVFCKTAMKPYDVVVAACLAVMDHFAPDAITVSSDGESDLWEAGVALAREVLDDETIGVPRSVIKRDW